MSTEPACSWRKPLRWVCVWRWPSPLAWLWLVWAALTWALTLPAIAAQEIKDSAPGPSASASTRVEQHVLWDETGSLSLQEARAGEFKPFKPLRRLPMEVKTTWLRLSISRADGGPGPTGPLYLRVLPQVFDSVILHIPDEQAPGGWRTTDLGDRARSSAFSIGDFPTANPIYLQLRSSYGNGLYVYAGSRDEVSAYNQKLAITLAVISTMFTFAWVLMLWRVVTHFNQLSLAISVFLPATLLRIWVTMGYGSELLNLPPESLNRIYVPVASVAALSAGWLFVLLATAIFGSARWFAWIWFWVALAFCNLILSFFQPGWAIRVIDGLMMCGALILLVSLTLAARKAPKSLKSWPAKIAFSSLVLIVFFIWLGALQLQGAALNTDAVQQADMVPRTVFIRSLIPIMLIGIASWTYERLRSEKLNQMQTDLSNTTASLELESKRLERQRNFTAMLAHELKNPLTASQMALSGIQQRLADDDPTQQRAEKIKASLQEINAIVDRCAEVDGYEQGQMPMTVHTFAVQQLLDLVEASNPSERIYTLTRGLPEGAALRSDLHYIKLILNNLLSNALKYSPPDSLVELQLCCRQTEKTMVLDISVTNEIGPAGVPEPDRLFERFYRAESARNQSGAGLGLWLSQALAGALGTRIVSQTEDNWISFTLTLTLNDPQS